MASSPSLCHPLCALPPPLPPRARIRSENGHQTEFWHGIRHAKGCLPGKPQVAQIGQAGAARFRADSVPERGLVARNRERADMEGCRLRKVLGLRCDSVRGGVAKVTISPSFCHSPFVTLFRRFSEGVRWQEMPEFGKVVRTPRGHFRSELAFCGSASCQIVLQGRWACRIRSFLASETGPCVKSRRMNVAIFRPFAAAAHCGQSVTRPSVRAAR